MRKGPALLFDLLGAIAMTYSKYAADTQTLLGCKECPSHASLSNLAIMQTFSGQVPFTHTYHTKRHLVISPLIEKERQQCELLLRRRGSTSYYY